MNADGDGRITGNDAVKFFSLSQLSRQELKQVYSSSFSHLIWMKSAAESFMRFVYMEIVTFSVSGVCFYFINKRANWDLLDSSSVPTCVV